MQIQVDFLFCLKGWRNLPITIVIFRGSLTYMRPFSNYFNNVQVPYFHRAHWRLLTIKTVLKNIWQVKQGLQLRRKYAQSHMFFHAFGRKNIITLSTITETKTDGLLAENLQIDNDLYWKISYSVIINNTFCFLSGNDAFFFNKKLLNSAFQIQSKTLFGTLHLALPLLTSHTHICFLTKAKFLIWGKHTSFIETYIFKSRQHDRVALIVFLTRSAIKCSKYHGNCFNWRPILPCVRAKAEIALSPMLTFM